MFIEVQSQIGSKVTCNVAHIVAIDVPSMTGPDAQPKVFLVGPIMIGVTRTEAERVSALVQQVQTV